MDVGNPSNFARLMDLYQNDFNAICRDIKGYAFTDDQTVEAMQSVFQEFKYLLDPHGAIGYLGLKQYLSENEGDVNGIFLETAHPAKFREVVEKAIHQKVDLPPALEKFINGKKRSIMISNDYGDFKKTLLHQLTGG
jgi:threonine synthase